MSAKGALPKLGAVALVLGGSFITATDTLPVFVPCRILYRTHQPVQDSGACQLFHWVGSSGLVLLAIAVIIGLVVALRYVVRRTSDT